jgi:hypothetical protein
MNGIKVFLVRLLVMTVVAFVLIGGALTLAADRASAPTPLSTTSTASKTLVVPDVRGQVYVFAKGILEDSGFAWQVNGAVRGYAANLVRTQSPQPGSIVIANGAPLIALTLARNPTFKQQGTPEDVAPYGATPLLLAPSNTR